MECFGDDSDDDDLGAEGGAVRRDRSCGVCRFHSNTEASLLAHVRNSAMMSSSSSSSSSSSEGVLRAIDDFCVSRHWMMHVGPEKGDILAGALRSSILAKLEAPPPPSRSSPSPSGNVEFVAVELGTYCGYASILMGRTMREMMASSDGLDCHLFTAEINGEYAEIATEMIRLSRMEDLISVHAISYDGHDTDIVVAIGDALARSSSRDIDEAASIDFLFIDHDKDAYRSDLCKLEASGMIRHGTRVVADNVLFANIEDYVGYVRRKEELGIVKTRTIPCHVEYSVDNDESREIAQQYRDGVGKCTCLD
jgi:catechol O-methyltransferase